MPVIKIGEHNEVVIPKKVRDELGVEPGDLVQVDFRAMVDVLYDNEPLSAEDQAGLREAQEDVKAGRTYGPFDSAKEAIKHLKVEPSEPSTDQS